MHLFLGRVTRARRGAGLTVAAASSERARLLEEFAVAPTVVTLGRCISCFLSPIRGASVVMAFSISLDRALLSIARGVLAGFAGTVAMTLSQAIEQRLSGRTGSTTPADGVAAVTGIAPKDETAQNRLNVLAHWGYGTGWGVARSLLDLAGKRGPLATGVHLAALLGSEQVLTPALGLGRPTPAYGATATATDLGHHVVYAAAVGTVFDTLSGDRAAGWAGRNGHPLRAA